MIHFRIFCSFWIVIIWCSSVAAFDIQQGIHGMQWGSSIAGYDNLTKVHESNQAAYYINSHMLYETANQPVPAVFYGFYTGQLFAVFIKLRSPNQFTSLERQFSTKYGEPKITRNTTTRLTIYRWKDANVKIKLKLRESPAEFKLAIYYSPLASKLNEEQLESATPDTHGKNPLKKDQTIKSTPLFEY